MPDAASVHRQKHLTYPNLLPGIVLLSSLHDALKCGPICIICVSGGFGMNGMAYDDERSSALPLVRGILQPWTHNTGGCAPTLTFLDPECFILMNVWV